ncbi:MAG: NAD+ synthase [Nitrososphaerota archaeon]|nr:NAD+ synthase [Candidatus Geocrenenecus dongiae]
MSDVLKIDFEETVREVVSFIRNIVGDRVVVIGLSGGVDSSVVVTLLVKALPPEKIYGLIMPTSFTPSRDVDDAILLAENFKINYEIIPIDSIVDSYAKVLRRDLEDPRYRMVYGNLRARIRMCILYFYANMLDGLVAGTGDKSEILIGYYTKYGDGGVDFLPVAHLYKTQLRRLGAYLGLPEHIYSKPSAPLLYPNHKALDEIPVDYSALDPLLYYIFDKGLSIREASEKAGLPIDIALWVCRRFHSTNHKRKTPPSLLTIKHIPPEV